MVVRKYRIEQVAWSKSLDIRRDRYRRTLKYNIRLVNIILCKNLNFKIYCFENKPTSVKPEMEVTIYEWNIPVLLYKTSKMCNKIKNYCKFWNIVVHAGTT